MFKSDFNSRELIKEYIYPRVISPNILFLIIMIILLIFWIILIVKECKKKKALNFNNNNSKHKFIYPLTFLIFIIIIILSSISIFIIYESSLYFNSSMCALFRIYIDIRDGDQSNGTYWKGIRDLQKDLVGDKVIINQLINSIELQENVTYDLQNNDPNKKYQDKTYYKEEENNNFYYDYSVSSPSSPMIKVYPIYTRNRKVDIENINLEYKIKLYPGVEVNEKIKAINEPIKKNPSLITSEFALVNDYLSYMLDTVQISAEEYLQYLVNYSKIVNNIVFPVLYSIFILSIIFSILGIIFLDLHVKKNKNIYSVFMHILWNLKFILVFLIIISIIIFRVFDIFGEDGSGLVQYATSESNLNSTDSIIFKGSGKVFWKYALKMNMLISIQK
jgi:formate-dependent nitrite reductase membrane component NrfD